MVGPNPRTNPSAENSLGNPVKRLMRMRITNMATASVSEHLVLRLVPLAADTMQAIILELGSNYIGNWYAFILTRYSNSVI